jgi:hypothetical protein
MGNFTALALGAVFAVGLACDTAQAFLVPLDDYSVEGTVYLNPGVSVDPTAMYFAAYYYDNFAAQPGVTVAQASLPTDTTYNATVSIPLDANITGFGLLGVYFDGGNAVVDSITPVPEPGSVSLLMTLGLLPTLLRRRRHA